MSMNEILETREYLRKKELERAREMLRMKMEGKTLEEIGDKFGITKQRVGQILAALLQKSGKKK